MVKIEILWSISLLDGRELEVRGKHCGYARGARSRKGGGNWKMLVNSPCHRFI